MFHVAYAVMQVNKCFHCFILWFLQKGELRCLLPRSLLNNGFFPESTFPGGTNHKDTGSRGFNYSWSGHRKMPSYINKLVFPEQFLTALRTITMKESEVYQVSSLLEEVRYVISFSSVSFSQYFPISLCCINFLNLSNICKRNY